MKANLYVLGVYRGEIEVGENSMVGLLTRGMFGEGMAKAAKMQAELDALCELELDALCELSDDDDSEEGQ